METTSPTTQKLSLYERLGGEANLKRIVNDVLDKNAKNPLIGHHFQNVDIDKLKRLVFEFFSMGIGGPHQYTGRDMHSAHKGLKINERDFEIANEDTIQALKENGIKEAEIHEVVSILNSMKSDVVDP